MYKTSTLDRYYHQSPHLNRIEGGKRTHMFLDKKRACNPPLVSIITIVRNSEKYIERTIRSVIKQTYQNLEYIIIDGDSTDQTLNIIKKYSNKIDYWLSEPDRGIYDAMNKGIALASGEIIAVLNAGDYYLPNTVELVIALYQASDKKHTLIAGTTQVTTRHGVTYNYVPILENIDKRMSVPQPSLFIPIETYKCFGLYSLNYRIISDYDFLLRIHKNIRLLCIPQVITHMAPMGASSNYFVKNIELHRLRVSHGAHYLYSVMIMLIFFLLNCLRFMLEKMGIWWMAEKIIYKKYDS